MHLLLMTIAMHDGEHISSARAVGSLEHERNGAGLERDREGAHEQVWAIQGALCGQALFSLRRSTPHTQGVILSGALALLSCS